MITIHKDQSFASNADNLSIFYDIYVPEAESSVVIQIAHGMVEHKGRYVWVCERLARLGFIVVINDCRGHGKSIDSAHPLGEMQGIKSAESSHNSNEAHNLALDSSNVLKSAFAQNAKTLDSSATKHTNAHKSPNGFEKAVADLHQLSGIIKARFKPTHYILLGHSMGSLLSRGYLLKYESELSAIVLSGSPAYNSLSGVGIMLAKILRFLRLEKSGAWLVNALSFGSFNAPFKKDKSEDRSLAWLCSDRAVVSAYRADKLCRFIFSLNSFIGLFGGLRCVNKAKLESSAHIPMLLVSGANDSCGDFGRGVVKIARFYEQMGVSVEMKLYPNARHEVLNDMCKDEVLRDIISFIKRALDSKN